MIKRRAVAVIEPTTGAEAARSGSTTVSYGFIHGPSRATPIGSVTGPNEGDGAVGRRAMPRQRFLAPAKKAGARGPEGADSAPFRSGTSRAGRVSPALSGFSGRQAPTERGEELGEARPLAGSRGLKGGGAFRGARTKVRRLCSFASSPAGHGPAWGAGANTTC